MVLTQLPVALRKIHSAAENMLQQKVYFDGVLGNLVGYFGKKMKKNNK